MKKEKSVEIKEIACQHCQTPMKKTKKVKRSMTLQLLAFLVFAAGIAAIFILPLACPFLIIGSLFMGYSKEKVWLCPGCGYFFRRA